MVLPCLSIGILHQDVGALQIPKIAQSLPEGLGVRIRRGRSRGASSRQQGDPGDVRRRLRVSREWRHEKAENEGKEQHNGGARHGSLLHSGMCRGYSTRYMPEREPKFCRLKRSHPWTRFADTPHSYDMAMMKTEVIRVCVSPEEKKSFREAAQRAGVPLNVGEGADPA